MSKNTAIRIAQNDLARCITSYGLSAGRHHFVDLWARDSLFATFGATAIGDYDTTKKTIETFLTYQRPDGLVPYRILRAASTIGKYLGRPRYLDRPAANFHSHQSGGLVPNGGLMTVIAVAEYVRRSGDRRFFQTHRIQLVKAVQWYESRFGDDLISEWFLCEWADAVLKVGKTLYTNILYWGTLGDIGEKSKQRVIGQKIHDAFWNGRYFADWIDWKRQDYFA